MKTIIIDNKSYKFKARLGSIKILQSEFSSDMDMLLKSDPELDKKRIEKFALRMVWEFIIPDEKTGKPFKTFDKFCDEIDLRDLNQASKKGFYMIWGLDPDDPRVTGMVEDRDSKNENPKTFLQS